MGHYFEDVDPLLHYPDHCRQAEVVAANVENEFLISKMIGTVEGLLYIRIVFPLSGSCFGYPVIERSFSIGVFCNELLDDPRIQNVHSMTPCTAILSNREGKYKRKSLNLRGI